MSQKSEHCEECGRLVIRGRMYLLDFEKVYCSQSCLNIGAEKIKAQLAVIPDLLEALEALYLVATSQEVSLEKQADAITLARAAIAKVVQIPPKASGEIWYVVDQHKESPLVLSFWPTKEQAVKYAKSLPPNYKIHAIFRPHVTGGKWVKGQGLELLSEEKNDQPRTSRTTPEVSNGSDGME